MEREKGYGKEKPTPPPNTMLSLIHPPKKTSSKPQSSSLSYGSLRFMQSEPVGIQVVLRRENMSERFVYRLVNRTWGASADLMVSVEKENVQGEVGIAGNDVVGMMQKDSFQGPRR